MPNTSSEGSRTFVLVGSECCAVWHRIALVGPRGAKSRYSSASSTFTSLRSRVSKPSVNQA